MNSGCINKIPLNPPLQKGEAVGMPRLIEMLPEVAWELILTPSAVNKSVVKGREDEIAKVIENDLMTLLERQK
jgi:hypothetical protein